MTKLDPLATLPLSRELNAEIARKLDDACKARELAKHDSRCAKCGAVVFAREAGRYVPSTGVLVHAVCPPKPEVKP